MMVKRIGQGLFILLVLMITACGGKATPQAVTLTPPSPQFPTAQPDFVIKSDTVDLSPGSTIEIQTPTPPPSEPIYGSVIINSINFAIPDGEVEPVIRFLGTIPTICNKIIFKVDPIDSKNQIIIHVFTTANLNVSCLKMTQPFDQAIRLTQVPSGTYTVWFNGNKLGEYSVP